MWFAHNKEENIHIIIHTKYKIPLTTQRRCTRTSTYYFIIRRIICKALKPLYINFYNIQLLNDQTKKWIIYEHFKAAKLRKRPSHYVESKISIKATLCGEPKAASIQFIFHYIILHECNIQYFATVLLIIFVYII